MKKHDKSKIAFSIIFLLLLLTSTFSLASASIIDEHTNIGKEAISETQNSPITQLILQYEDYYHLGNILTDISVVGYFTIDTEEDDGIFAKIFKALSFRVGKSYRATHSQNACLRALQLAETDKQKVLAYGTCSHLVQDAISHNQAVPGAIRKTNLFNGMIHSIKEIHDKNLFTNQQDRVYTRQILSIAQDDPEVVDFFTRVYVEDPALSKVSIPHMIDFFVTQVQPEAEYRLGFRSFFALPAYIYWVILLLFFVSLSIAGLSIRRIRDGQRDSSTFLTAGVFLVMLGFVGIAIYGLIAGNVWAMWEVISQYLFSPATYALGGFLLFVGGYMTFRWVTKDNKVQNLSALSVAAFLLLVGAYMMTLPTGLTIGNEQAIHDLQVEQTKKLLTQPVDVFIRTIQDPVGYAALESANASGASARTTFMLTLIFLLGINLFFTFKRRKK